MYVHAQREPTAPYVHRASRAWGRPHAYAYAHAHARVHARIPKLTRGTVSTGAQAQEHGAGP